MPYVRSVLPTPGRKRAERTIGAGVAVRADYHVPGHHETLFGQEGVLDAAGATLVEVRDAVAFSRTPWIVLQFSADMMSLFGREMVEHEDDPLGIEHAVGARPSRTPRVRGGR